MDDTLSESSYSTATSSQTVSMQSDAWCRCCKMTLRDAECKHRYCGACFLRYRTRKYGWNVKEQAALATISSYLRRREIQQYCRLQYEALIKYNQLKESKRSRLRMDGSTNTEPDPLKYSPLEFGPKLTLEGCANRQSIMEHEVQWLRNHSLSTLTSLTGRLAALERIVAQGSVVQVPWVIR